VAAGSKREEARVHLTILGRPREVVLEVPIEPTPLASALPLARAIAAAVSSAAEEEAAADGRATSCSKGCAACCRHLIPVSPVEAHALAAHVERQPSHRQARLKKRFAAAVKRLEEAGLLDARQPRGRDQLVARISDPDAGEAGAWDRVSRQYFALQIPCPFLEDEVCSAYAERPFACREYSAVTPAEFCKELSDRVQVLSRPVDMGEALARLESELNGTEKKHVPLVLALEWAGAHGARARRLHDGEKIFETLMACIDEQHSETDEHQHGRSDE